MRRSLRERLHGHYWTFVPHFVGVLRPPSAPDEVTWEGTVDDPAYGEVRLTGRLHVRDPERLVVVLHGLGGSADSRYVVEAAREASRMGLSCLRANMRGADRSGQDFYHAGLTDDVRAILRAPELAGFRDIYLMGFSMGGHILLRWASEPDRDPRVRALAAVCAPLDLSVGAHRIQRPGGLPYQWNVLRGLKEMYAATEGLRPTPIPVREAMAIRTILEWDSRVVVPRFGFDDRAHYYETMSAGPILERVAVPALFVAAEADPIVTADQLRPWLAREADLVEVAWTRGGHVAFPRRVITLSPGRPETMDGQVLGWLLERG